MNMEGEIIAVWGSPNSGKTTFATKLARAIHASYQANVIVLYCDLETPTLSVLFPNEKSENLGSVGKVLAKTEVEKTDILMNAITLKQFDGLCFLGYKDGENRFTYPKFGRAKAEDLLNALCEIARNTRTVCCQCDCKSIVHRHIWCSFSVLCAYAFIAHCSDRRIYLFR